jgi:8-oxo-dGTP pyrophosphatase MutT (NUDIX family)
MAAFRAPELSGSGSGSGSGSSSSVEIPNFHRNASDSTIFEVANAVSLKTPPHVVSGIANAITYIGPDGNTYIFLLEGDRHFWDKTVKFEWRQYFYGNKKDLGLNGAPFQVYTVTPEMEFLGKTYNAVEQARYILKHMLSKGWVPIVCFNNEDEAVNAVKTGNISNVSDEMLSTLHGILMYFTGKVSGVHYHEIVMGAVDGGPTDDPEKIISTLRKETFEEAGFQLVPGQTIFICWADPYTSRKTGVTSTTAIFQTVIDKDTMEAIWKKADSHRRPEGFFGWRCPHAWYKTIPGIYLNAAANEKAIQETRNGAWHELHEALNKIHFVDSKNKAVLMKLFSTKVDQVVSVSK